MKVHIDIRNSNTSSILIKAIMPSQNNIAKESSSLQNHIVWLCSIFTTQNTHIMPIPVSAKQLFHTLVFSNFFNSHTIHERQPWIYHLLGNVAEIQNFPTSHKDLSMERPATSRKRVHLHTLVDR